MTMHPVSGTFAGPRTTAAERAPQRRQQAADAATAIAAFSIPEEPAAAGEAAVDAAAPVAPPRSLRTGMPPLRLPTLEEVRQLASELSAELASRFADQGLAATPQVRMVVDDQGRIQFSGPREDLPRIEALFAADPDLQRSVRDLSAVSSHAHALNAGDHAAFQAEYRASANAEAVVSKYAHLFRHRPPADIAIAFEGSEVEVTAHGKPLGTKTPRA